MKLLLLLIISVFASNEKENPQDYYEPKILESSILVKIEEDEYIQTNRSNYIGASYSNQKKTWAAQRWSKTENKQFHNGSYKDEERAAHASDTLARKLIANGEKGHKLNFPDDDTEVYPEFSKISHYIGVSYSKRESRWCAQRWSKVKKQIIYNGRAYKDEETAAHASDTLARKLIANGETGHKLNFHDDDTEVYGKEKSSSYFGVCYCKRDAIWRAERYSKNENKAVHNGSYKIEDTAAHASDTLARTLIANGEKGHKLNFSDDEIEVYAENQTNKRKRTAEFEDYHKCGNLLDNCRNVMNKKY